MKTKLIIVTLLHTTMPIVDTLLTLKTCCRFLLKCVPWCVFPFCRVLLHAPPIPLSLDATATIICSHWWLLHSHWNVMHQERRHYTWLRSSLAVPHSKDTSSNPRTIHSCTLPSLHSFTPKQKIRAYSMRVIFGIKLIRLLLYLCYKPSKAHW
jgi:hypothetical protein